MGRTLVKIAGLFLGLLLFITGIAKAAGIWEFASSIAREVPMPRELGMICAVVIVTTEIFVGAGFYFKRTRKLCGIVTALLFAVFVILILTRLAEGRDFQCDCFGILALRLPLIHHLLLDVALTVIAILVAYKPAARHVRHSSPRRLPFAFLIPLLAGALVLVWVLLSAFRSTSAAPARDEKRTEMDISFPVKTGIARRGTLVKGILSSGYLRAARTVELMPRVNGEIIAVNGCDGKSVARGETVASIDSTEFRLAFERASAALLAAQIEYRTLSTSPFLQAMDTIQARRDLEAAREQFQRVRTAYAAGRIDGPAFIRARREYESTRAFLSANREDVIANKSGLALARETYERAKRDLEATEVRAPFAGRIAGWDAAVGMQVHAGRAVCTLVDISNIVIDADITEGEAGKIRIGRKALISCMAIPGVQFAGTVCALSPVIDLRTRMMRVTIALSIHQANRAAAVELRPGMYATLLIETDRLAKRLLVPREALLVRELRQLVFTMENGLAKWHYVETGEENREFVEIRSGLAEGDTIIVEGHEALAHDARVFVKK